MTCRCGSASEHARRAAETAESNRRAEVSYLREELKKYENDLSNFVVNDLEEINGCLILKVEYKHKTRRAQPDCTFNGTKILVYEGKTAKDAIKWKKIDPHFRSKNSRSPYEAPSPTARFPGDERGWIHAKAFASSNRGIPVERTLTK